MAMKDRFAGGGASIRADTESCDGSSLFHDGLVQTSNELVTSG